MQAPADGERAALRGYRWQYDHIAQSVYDALSKGDFQELRLTDPTAGRVDDLVLSRRGRTDAYQFKSGGTGFITFRDVIRDRQTRGGNHGPSLVRSLADGWKALKDTDIDVRVHLVTEEIASVHDDTSGREASEKPKPGHFRAFIAQVIEPIQVGTVELADVPQVWKPVLERLRTAAGLEPDDFAQFLQALHFDFGAGTGLPGPESVLRPDIAQLSDALLRRVSEASSVVKLDKRGVLDLVGWSDRTRLHSVHEFPINLDTYAPLDGAIKELTEAIETHDCGYIAVTGSPGSGKSTLLSQVLTGSSDHVVRYYAHVPGTGPSRTRLSGRSFLHDLVLMLGQKGFETYERRLASGDVTELRRQLFDQLAEASKRFGEDGHRTVVIVDGLDHVARDYKGDDALFAELPEPQDLGDGILLIVGSRTLDPLRAEARQQVEERGARIDLGEHRLSGATVIDICRRAPVTAHLDPALHERIADLSEGHPLALGYLLNRLDARGERAAEVLSSAPRYSGNVEGLYVALWSEIEDDDDIVDLLGVCSRLRVGFTSEWLASWVPDRAVRAFHRKLRYLFRQHPDGWHFFHDSFRQFAADRTALGDKGPGDPDADARAHHRVADLCADSADARIAAEELHHRYGARDGDAVLSLAGQVAFREQYRGLRSASLIRDDLALALEVAADRGDVLTILRLLLALTEVNERASALESINMPALLFEAGLVDEAIAYCSGNRSSVRLAKVYGLAARLGAANDPAGRKLFDRIDHFGLDDPLGPPTVGEENDVAVAWARAAVRFRPISRVIDVVSGLIEIPPEADSDFDESNGQWLPDDPWRRHSAMMQALLEESTVSGDRVALDAIIACVTEVLQETRRLRQAQIATLTEIGARATAALLSQDAGAEARATRLDGFIASLEGQPLFLSTMLDVAELLAQHKRSGDAAKLLDRVPYNEPLTAQDLSSIHSEGVLSQRIRYWRLRFLLVDDVGDVPDSELSTGDSTTPASPASESPSGSTTRDRQASSLATQIDNAARSLARLDAAVTLGVADDTTAAWETLVSLLDLFPRSSVRSSPELSLMAERKPELMSAVVDVAARYGDGLLQLLSGAFARRFEHDPRRWPLPLRLDLAESLRSAGADAPWYEAVLSEMEALVPSASVSERLDTLEDLIQRYARAGDSASARRLVHAAIPMAFGISSRKDYQLDSWVAWLASAYLDTEGALGVHEATWLARLLTALEPTTTGAPGSAAAGLPAAVVPEDAMAAVRIFEYLVRNGTVRHFDALAGLLGALVRQVGPSDVASLRLAIDLVAELVAPGASSAYPELAVAIRTAVEQGKAAEGATEVLESLASRTDRYALPSSRAEWRRALGLPPKASTPSPIESADSGSDYGALVLTDGRRIAAGEVESLIDTVGDIADLRSAEATDSHFGWNSVVRQHSLTTDEVLRLSEVFGDDLQRHADVLATLGEAAEQNGDHDDALRLAASAFQGSSNEGWWGWHEGGHRSRAAAIIVRLGGPELQIAACHGLVHQAMGNPWVPRYLILESQHIARSLGPTVPASAVWPEIRVYLDGMAEGFNLGEDDVLRDHGCRWWLQEPIGDSRAPSEDSTAAAGLAELAVAHLSHPTWLIRDAAGRIVARALQAGNTEVADALARFAQPGASDDTLERAGRCLAAARESAEFVVPRVLEPLQRTLAYHRSQILRGLSAFSPPKIYRPLSPTYHMALPDGVKPTVGVDDVFPYPHANQYRELARGTGIDLDALLAVAGTYASEALAVLPEQEAVQTALILSSVEHARPLEELSASRAAFGRVLSDLTDAGLLDDAPPHVHRFLRTFDLDLVTRTPSSRPMTIPEPPPAGHEQTIARWQDEIEERLDEYVTAAVGDRTLIGARARLTVLNWGHLEEEFVCGTTVGSNPVADGDMFEGVFAMTLREMAEPAIGIEEPLAIRPLVRENAGFVFHHLYADWLAFRPEVAAMLGWGPDPDHPGLWYTSSGEIAVETVWWVDGWWGHAGTAFDDTEAQGQAVTLTSAGLDDVLAVLEEVTLHFVIKRGGRDGEGNLIQAASVTRSMSLRESA